jgi:hypothetical protein
VTTFDEWARGGSNPLDGASTPPLIPRIQIFGGVDYLTGSYLRLTGGIVNRSDYTASGVVYASEGALHPATWDQTPLPAVPPSLLPPAPDGFTWGTVRLPLGGPGGFLRIQTSTAPAGP